MSFQKNLSAAQQHINALGDGVARHLIAGQWRSSAVSFDVHSPADNGVIAVAARGDAATIDEAAQAAQTAFAEWKHVGVRERRDRLYAIADAIVARAEEIALVESCDSGQPLRFMRKAAARAAENFRFFADRAASAHDGHSLPTAGHWNLTTRQPIGAVGIITPWNTPFMLATWKIAPALAAGCTVVHKPAEWSPLSATILADIINAHLPKGVFNLVHGFGEEVGVALTEHPLIRAIAFVGDSVTGGRIMAQGAPTLKRVHFELGGKNPVAVFADAARQRALDAAVLMIYSLNGERCTSSSRLLVQESLYDDFVTDVAERARRIKVGHPLDAETELGPLIHPDHLQKVVGYFNLAEQEGARIPAGGSVIDGAGNYAPATVFADVKPSMRVAREEIFGPVLSVFSFREEEEAIALANDIDYGLAAYVWTADGARGLRFARAVEAGMVWVNSENVRHLPAPFGGMKSSGIGRDGGDYSFDFYMEQKNICIATGEHDIAKLGA